MENHPHTWPVALQPLEHRAFRLVWTGTLVSNAGSWMQRVAMGWLVYVFTGSATWLGIEAFAAGIPAVLLLPFGGVIADRVDRRKLLIVANLANAGLAVLLALGWWSGLLRVWHIVAASFLSGVVSSAMVPTSQSLLPAVVGEDHVPGAIALNSVQYNVARALGPALGGVALAWGGPGWCFLINGLSFLAMVGVFAIIRDIPKPQISRQPILSGLREGAHFIWERADLRLALLLVGLLALGGAPMVSMLPALAKDVLHQGAGAYSILLTSFGVGAAAVGVLLTLRPALKNAARLIFTTVLLVGLCHMGLPWSGPFPLAVLLVGLAGGCFVGAMIELGTSLLLRTPDMFRGRVSSMQQMVFRAAQPLGGLLAGLLAARTNVSVAFLVFGGVLSTLTLGLWITHARQQPSTES